MTPPGCHIAELNVARARYDFDDPRMFEFVISVEGVYEAADRSPGFVWRLKSETGGMNSPPDDPRTIVNLSVWEDAESLRAYVFKGLHREYLDRLAEWFERPEPVHLVMWWIAEGELPTLEDGLRRLRQLRRRGPGELAFDWAWLRRQSRS